MATKKQLKSPLEFADVREWRTYVRSNASAEDQEYILARGRTTLYLRFYELRNLPVPELFLQELLLLESASSAHSATELEDLNARIFADMMQLLFTLQPQKASPSEGVLPITPGEIVSELLQHLETANPYFMIWARFRASHDISNKVGWDDFSAANCPSPRQDDLEFTRLMAQLGKLLQLYQQRDHPLPARARYSIWFLHYVQDPTRNAQTRALLANLLEGLETCAFA